VALVAATCGGLRILPPADGRWGVNDESSRYPVGPRPPFIPASGFCGAQQLKETFSGVGAPVVVAARAIGILGYYSELPLVDEYGLTDAFVSRRVLRSRGNPGHEKGATRAYLDARGVRLRHFAGSPAYNRVRLEDGCDQFFLYRYDPAVASRWKQLRPGLVFTRFEDYLDANFCDLSAMPAPKVAGLLQEFDHYYFSLSHDETRRRPFVARFRQLLDFEDRRFPAGSSSDGSAAPEILSPASAGQFEIDGYQGDALLSLPPARRTNGDGAWRLPPFMIRGTQIGFLFGSKGRSRDAYVALLIDNREVGKWFGEGDSTLRSLICLVTPWIGRQAQIVLVNRSPHDVLYFDMFWEADAEK
jgi:hypothetical protein